MEKVNKTCPICGNANHNNRNDITTAEVIRAQKLAIKRAGLTAASGNTDAAHCASLKKGDIDANRVCVNCYTDENGDLLQ